ncbi:S1 family peptidase [Corynebacterium alimapuense]|uniref:Serine protease n=1 Tax=Corynebacterium alimapuense TaxID=1576874 RepID=A0A3M8K7D8_9CORY|nr:serine protease [Corynebacterium alimapuense]RNE49141.1 serine protease [Corynebacterium alimapuense]
MSSNITLRIKADSAYCSGALISPDLMAHPATSTDLVLTCAHFFRSRSGQVRVAGSSFRAEVLGVVSIPGTDLAVARLSKQSPPRDLIGISDRPPTWFSNTVTEGFGGSAKQPRLRFGRVIFRTPVAFSRRLDTLVRPGAVIYNNPKAIRGDSGGPVFEGGKIVAVQSLISDPFGYNLGLATVSQVGPHRRAIARAIEALQGAYPSLD